ncbi:hypothetical protein GCM10023340_44610 [Nocardioides marinquilinus]|uniref:Protein-glutamine gamma-glutamyltransferase-like C-terminal domain-containing protein n=1 Tax=Nocardioides marinquilinus TaxID=1210400 RepID=A0ABP9Q4H6_9ACTN
MAVAAATALVLLLAVWAASTGPGDPLPGEGVQPARVTPSETEQTSAPVEVDEGGEEPDDEGSLNTLMSIVLGVIGAAMLASVLWLLLAVRPQLRRERRRRARTQQDHTLGADDADVVRAVGAALADDAEEQLRALEEGSPRNGIVACWHRFEVRAAAVGVAREPWETSSEFTMRLLDLVAADDRAVGRLALRYREARFSDHPVTEADRGEARDALTVVQEGLRARPSGRVAGERTP